LPSACFFFHAEDGIRYFHVTGVQTCALPILTPCIAESTMIGFSSLRSSSLRIVISRLILSAEPTELPPNFKIFIIFIRYILRIGYTIKKAPSRLEEGASVYFCNYITTLLPSG